MVLYVVQYLFSPAETYFCKKRLIKNTKNISRRLDLKESHKINPQDYDHDLTDYLCVVAAGGQRGGQDGLSGSAG